MVDSFPCNGDIQVELGIHGIWEKSSARWMFHCMSEKIEVGKEYLIETNFDRGMSLLQDVELAYDVFELF